MHDALRRVDVLRQLDLANAVDAERVACRRDSRSSTSHGRRQQLPRLPRIAELVRALRERTRRAGRARAAAPASGSPPPATARRERRRQREAADPRERVGDDLRLDLELARIGDVRVEAAAAQRIGERRRGDRATAPRCRPSSA